MDREPSLIISSITAFTRLCAAPSRPVFAHEKRRWVGVALEIFTEDQLSHITGNTR
jgi:hypothetical protein